jgi:hypothetical protein
MFAILRVAVLAIVLLSFVSLKRFSSRPAVRLSVPVAYRRVRHRHVREVSVHARRRPCSRTRRAVAESFNSAA